MVEHNIKIGSSFESKAIAELVQKASQFKCHISLVMGEKTANAKSIMGIISLNLRSGDIVKVVAIGEDENRVESELRYIFGV